MRHKKKKRHRLYAFTVLTLGIVIVILSIIVFFYVQKIEITGNEYTKDSDIIEIIQKDPASVNTLYILSKYKMNKYDMPECFDSVKISLTAPWAIKVEVKEKPIIGYVYDDDGYVYFDKDGLVVNAGREVYEGVPHLEGFDVKKAELYKPLGVKDKKLFSTALELIEEIKNYELAPNRIVCDNGELYLYFEEVCVAVGNIITSEKIAQIKPIVSNLEGQSGTLHLEFYENESSTVTFNQGEYPEAKIETEEVADEENMTEEADEENITEESSEG